MKLAQLNAGPLQRLEEALQFAKKARDIAPNDAKAAALLGRVVFQSGDYPWSYSLLQESARQLESDPILSLDLARAAYSLGKVGEARQAMNRVLTANPDPSRAEEAQSFLALTELDGSSKDLLAAEPEVEKILEKKPDFVPALMIKAAILRQRGDFKQAAALYEKVLTRFPDFVPAQKFLGILYATDSEHLPKAYDLVTKARKAYPDDPEVAAALGEISYQRREFDYARQLLQESARRMPLSPRSLYYLGMSHWQRKAKAETESLLKQAVSAGLQDPLATEAQRVLAELRQ
jgi:tetratricopeptide (TPR) repeat protein